MKPHGIRSVAPCTDLVSAAHRLQSRNTFCTASDSQCADDFSPSHINTLPPNVRSSNVRKNTMTDPLGLTLIPIITGGISSTVQIVLAIVRFWQAQKDRRIQNQAYQSTAPASTAAKTLQSLMGVQSSFWEKNPTLFQALGNDAARMFPRSHAADNVGFLKDTYSKSNGYLSQLAQFAGQMPEKMDWKSASEGLGSVNRQLREMFAQHLGKVISKVRHLPVPREC